MFTAWGSQTPFRQIGYKGTKNNANTQTKLILFLGEFHSKYPLTSKRAALNSDSF